MKIGQMTTAPEIKYKPIRPLFCYLGGKFKLRKKIISLFPKHICYCEPFCGSATVLFGKDPATSAVEVINDINSDITNLLLVVKYKPLSLIESFNYLLHSREIFEKFRDEPIDNLSDVERAVRTLYLFKMSYGGAGRNFGYSAITPSLPSRLTSIPNLVKAINKRLELVTIENLEYEDVIQRYDRPGTFFYLDPPYYQASQPYVSKFEERDFIHLADILEYIQGKFLLSSSNSKFIRKLFKKFNIIELQTTMHLANKRRIPVKENTELLIANFQLKGDKE
jgi:DNA adenine methylase